MIDASGQSKAWRTSGSLNENIYKRMKTTEFVMIVAYAIPTMPMCKHMVNKYTKGPCMTMPNSMQYIGMRVFPIDARNLFCKSFYPRTIMAGIKVSR